MTGAILILGILMVLPVSALIARRSPIGSWIKMALAWTAIFLVLFLVVSLWRGAAWTGASLHRLFR